MIDSKTLIEYTRHPELALQNLTQVFELLNGTDDADLENVCDLLENCGPPREADIPTLCQQLESANATQVYWASTLLGRLGSSGVSTDARAQIQHALSNVIDDADVELASRERAAWAIGELGDAGESCRAVLRKHVETAPPRLKRLLESALGG
jgi:PBS lyase HEAT-like repeat